MAWKDDIIQAALSPYSYVEFTIPAGTKDKLTLPFHIFEDHTLNGTYLYYEADSSVYTNNASDGLVRVFSVGYQSQVDLTKGGKPQLIKEPVGYVRFYVDNMVKDSKGKVKGGKVKVYYKPAVFLENPEISGQTFLSYTENEALIPSYYTAHIEQKAQQIRSNMMDVGQNGETFIFITDTHWESNTGNSPELVRYLLHNLNIKVILNGGDFINQGERAPMAKAMQTAVSSYLFRDTVMLCAFGNHDSNWNNWNHQQDYPERYFDRKCQYALMQKHMEDAATYFADGWNCYHDRPTTKTRFVVIDTGEKGEYAQFTPLGNVLKATPSGYSIIIMAHWLYGGSKTSACTKLEQMIDAYNKRTGEYASAKARILLLLGGHIHNDMSWKTANGTPVVLTDCDAAGRSSNTKYPPVKRTVTEQAFDVITVDYSTGNIKVVRIGRGADRSFKAVIK